jgi:hypothetical protein
MTGSPFSPTSIAPCGMNCGVCRAYLREKNPCHGCTEADQNMPKTRVNCRLRVCDRRAGPFCCDCEEFPCKRLQHLDARYRVRYGMSEVENLECIRDHGLAAFLESERRRWVSDEGVLCVHDRQRYPVRGDDRAG